MLWLTNYEICLNHLSNISKHSVNMPSIIIFNFTTIYILLKYNVLCSHVAAILNFGGQIDFQVRIPIENER